jgi:uncharacterized glyoxalase superfamily protein PhnB
MWRQVDNSPALKRWAMIMKKGSGANAERRTPAPTVLKATTSRLGALFSMRKTPTQQIIPYLYYEDVGGAMRWLARAFGLRKYGSVMSRPDGAIFHAAMKLGDGIVMMGCPGAKYRSPKRLGQATQSLLLRLESGDLDEHFKRAKDAGGAVILQKPETMFGRERRYGAADPEGHEWYFTQALRKSARDGRRRSKQLTKKRS